MFNSVSNTSLALFGDIELIAILLKAAVIVKTNDELFEFKVPKKQLSAAEKLVNKVRNA